MKMKIFPYLAALLAASAMGGGKINGEPSLPVITNPNVITQVNPADFGVYQAGKRTHKRYLRAHRLGKFAKGRR